MKLDMIGIVTKDMKQGIEFYKLLDFEVSFGDETTDYVELNNEGVRISLNTKTMITGVFGFEPTSLGDKVELAFLCENQTEIIDKVKILRQANYEIVKEPWSAPWGQFYALVRDFDGNIISLFVNEQ